MIELRSASLRVVIDTERGGEIVHVGRPDGPNTLFYEPWTTPLRASASMSYGNGTLDWLSHYRGGWQVMFPNVGDECTVDGIPHPVHGEVSSAPTEVIRATVDELVLRSPTRLPVQLERTIRISADRPVLWIDERIDNDSDLPFAYAWGHHPAFAARTGMDIDLPAGPVRFEALGATGTWPAVARPDGRMEALDRVPAPPVSRVGVLPDRPAGWAALREPGTGHGVALAWDLAAFPHLALWQQIGGPEFPWYGRARIVALEPVSIWPGDGLARAIERGQARTLAPGGSAAAWITLSLFPATNAMVSGVDRAGLELAAASSHRSSPKGSTIPKAWPSHRTAASGPAARPARSTS